MRFFLTLTLLVISLQAIADCKPFMSLEGTMFIPGCDSDKCTPGAEAVYKYADNIPENDDQNILVLSLHSSPWRLYDGEMRILSIEEAADIAKPYIAKGVKRIILMASWSGVAPGNNEKSLAQKLSDALDGFPVSGMDGFVWLAPDGSIRTSHQAFSIWKYQGQYKIQEGAEVMVSMVAGWPVMYEGDFRRDKNSDGIMHAAAGWDIFFLCPDSALQSFEAAAQSSNTVAGYNAAVIRLERNNKGDVEAAISLLDKAASAGDKNAKALLSSLKEQGN